MCNRPYNYEEGRFYIELTYYHIPDGELNSVVGTCQTFIQLCKLLLWPPSATKYPLFHMTLWQALAIPHIIVLTILTMSLTDVRYSQDNGSSCKYVAIYLSPNGKSYILPRIHYELFVLLNFIHSYFNLRRGLIGHF